MSNATQHPAEPLKTLRPAVRRMAYALSRQLPASAELDDLEQAGMIGLHEAMGRYVDGDIGLEGFAFHRVRGAMLDELRVLDWAPRSCRRLQRRIEAASARPAHRNFRSPTAAELAGDLGLTIELLQAGVHQAETSKFVNIEDLGATEECLHLDSTPDETAVDPVEVVEAREQREALRSGLERLSPRKRDVVHMHYFEGMSQKDIGVLLGVSESRVCQLNREALTELRATLSCPR